MVANSFTTGEFYGDRNCYHQPYEALSRVTQIKACVLFNTKEFCCGSKNFRAMLKHK